MKQLEVREPTPQEVALMSPNTAQIKSYVMAAMTYARECGHEIASADDVLVALGRYNDFIAYSRGQLSADYVEFPKT